MIIVRSINALREKLGWTQERMAQAVYLSQSMISKYEQGHHIPAWNKNQLIELASEHGLKLMLKDK